MPRQSLRTGTRAQATAHAAVKLIAGRVLGLANAKGGAHDPFARMIFDAWLRFCVLRRFEHREQMAINLKMHDPAAAEEEEAIALYEIREWERERGLKSSHISRPPIKAKAGAGEKYHTQAALHDEVRTQGLKPRTSAVCSDLSSVRALVWTL